jgi:hypothetical protein
LLQVLGDVFASGAHLRIELKGLEMHLRSNLAADAAQRRFERFQAYDAPGTADIGDKIDSDVLVHRLRRFSFSADIPF